MMKPTEQQSVENLLLREGGYPHLPDSSQLSSNPSLFLTDHIPNAGQMVTQSFGNTEQLKSATDKPVYQWQHSNRGVLPYSWWKDCTEADFNARDNKPQFNVRIMFETNAITETLRIANVSQKKRIENLEGEDKISAAVIERCCNLLAQIAITIKGEPKELTRHSYHDLPELVSVLHLENELHKAKIDDLEQDLQFVERWANHHGTKPNVTAQEALSCIQHYPSIAAITKSYKDGSIPNTGNPYAEIETQAKRIAELEAAVKANHEWHQEHDDYDGYQESELCTINTATLDASKSGSENGK